MKRSRANGLDRCASDRCLAGNAANHEIRGDHRTALAVLKITWQLGLWFHWVFGNPNFKSSPFISPSAPKDESKELRAELALLNKTLADHQAAHHEAATPALHTTEIFGVPIFTYGYREAVVDGYLVDHEPPVQINTQLSTDGIKWRVGESVPVYDASPSQVELFTTPDEIHIEVDGFNRKVITESFNQVVCEYLAGELDPSTREQTLIFCVNDAHADLVVDLRKQAFAKQYGSVAGFQLFGRGRI